MTEENAGSGGLVSTKIVEYLDKAVEKNLLFSNTSKAKGKLEVGTLLQDYLDYYVA